MASRASTHVYSTRSTVGLRIRIELGIPEDHFLLNGNRHRLWHSPRSDHGPPLCGVFLDSSSGHLTYPVTFSSGTWLGPESDLVDRIPPRSLCRHCCSRWVTSAACSDRLAARYS